MRRPRLDKRWKNFFYKRRLRQETRLYNETCLGLPQEHKGRSLYASPVGEKGKYLLGKIIERFGVEKFDYLIFAYDDVILDEDIFTPCRIIREKGLRWHFLKKYLTPEICNRYDYIFVWPDDIDIIDFNPCKFLKIVRENNLQLTQPALTHDSYFTWEITLRNEKYALGRYVDFVEIMVPVLTRQAWECFWNMIESDKNYWGWGYDFFARSVCGYKNMGIIDCMPVRHLRPVGEKSSDIEADKKYIMNKYREYDYAQKVIYATLR